MEESNLPFTQMQYMKIIEAKRESMGLKQVGTDGSVEVQGSIDAEEDDDARSKLIKIVQSPEHTNEKEQIVKELSDGETSSLKKQEGDEKTL